MGRSNEVSQQKFNFICSRCGNIIKPSEKMITISASLEMPKRDGSIECVESSAGSSVCFACASILSSEIDILINSVSDGREADTTLKARCSEKGFYFTLQCSDGISLANSRLFTWQQISQLLIAADPDMFGTLDEPLHQVFPENLELLGYYVPNWQATSRKTNRGDIQNTYGYGKNRR